jgi:phage terminase large subunit-like protein
LELLQLIQEKEQRQRNDPLKYAKEHQKQVEARNSDKAVRVLFWGNRVGKTEWGAQETARYALGKHPTKLIDLPIEIWIACPSFEVQEDTTQKKLLKYIPYNEIASTEKLRGDILRKITLKNGTVIVFKSYEQGREKFQGVGKRLIWFDEEPPSDIWEECFVRQEAGVQLDIIMTMTPVNGMTWVYDDIYMDTGNPDLYVSEASWEDNPFLTNKQKEQMLRGLKSEEAIEVRKFGKFVARVGLVCSWWRREKHLREYTEFPDDWSYYEVLDGGWSDPAAWLLLAFDTQNNLHILDGYSESQLSDEQIKEKRDTKIGKLLIRRGYSDNDNPRLVEDLHKAGMKLFPIEKKPNETKSWDETMADAIADYGTIQKGTGEPRLFVNKNLTWLIQQIENLKWLEIVKKEGREIKPQWDDHRRYKHHWDGMYALAYFCVDFNKPTGSTKPIVTKNTQNRSKWAI